MSKPVLASIIVTVVLLLVALGTYLSDKYERATAIFAALGVVSAVPTIVSSVRGLVGRLHRRGSPREAVDVFGGKPVAPPDIEKRLMISNEIDISSDQLARSLAPFFRFIGTPGFNYGEVNSRLFFEFWSYFTEPRKDPSVGEIHDQLRRHVVGKYATSQVDLLLIPQLRIDRDARCTKRDRAFGIGEKYGRELESSLEIKDWKPIWPSDFSDESGYADRALYDLVLNANSILMLQPLAVRDSTESALVKFLAKWKRPEAKCNVLTLFDLDPERQRGETTGIDQSIWISIDLREKRQEVVRCPK